MKLAVRRAALSLIEVLIAVGVLSLLVGLLLAAVQSARHAALRTRSLNKLRQISMALHGGSESLSLDGAVGGFVKANPRNWREFGTMLDSNPRQFAPHGLIAYGIDGGDDARLRHQVKPYFLSPADPSLVGRVDWTDPASLPMARWEALPQGGRVLVFPDGGPTSYAFNMTGFLGPARLPHTLSDGTSATIAFAEKYFTCRRQSDTDPNAKSWMCYNMISPAYDDIVPGILNNLGSRRPSFADAGWGDVVPVTAGGVSRPSVPGLTFQCRPLPAEADMRLCQSPFPGGLPVSLFDGSARLVATGVAPEAFWGAVTPAAGDGAGLD